MKWSDESEQTVTSGHFSSWYQLSTKAQENTHTRTQGMTGLSDQPSFDDSKAQSSLGDRVNHLGKGEEPW